MFNKILLIISSMIFISLSVSACQRNDDMYPKKDPINPETEVVSPTSNQSMMDKMGNENGTDLSINNEASSPTTIEGDASTVINDTRMENNSQN